MDSAHDGGITWRNTAVDWLEARGTFAFDPTDKPINLGGETYEDRTRRKGWLAAGMFDELAAEIKVLRGCDLRMVDITDFTIVYLDRTQFPCGTYEELFLANREMKPVLVMSPHGRENTSLWLYGTIPHQHIFYDWDSLYAYLDHVDQGEEVDRLKRWYFFDRDRLYRILNMGEA